MTHLVNSSECWYGWGFPISGHFVYFWGIRSLGWSWDLLEVPLPAWNASYCAKSPLDWQFTNNIEIALCLGCLSDTLVELAVKGTSVAEIFNLYGEGFFRNKEVPVSLSLLLSHPLLHPSHRFTEYLKWLGSRFIVWLINCISQHVFKVK